MEKSEIEKQRWAKWGSGNKEIGACGSGEIGKVCVCVCGGGNRENGALETMGKLEKTREIWKRRNGETENGERGIRDIEKSRNGERGRMCVK